MSMVVNTSSTQKVKTVWPSSVRSFHYISASTDKPGLPKPVYIEPPSDDEDTENKDKNISGRSLGGRSKNSLIKEEAEAHISEDEAENEATTSFVINKQTEATNVNKDTGNKAKISSRSVLRKMRVRNLGEQEVKSSSDSASEENSRDISMEVCNLKMF